MTSDRPMAPDLPILIYDGDCAFCTRSVELGRRWIDRKGRYAIRAWQQASPGAYGLTVQDCVDAAQFVDEAGRAHAGHLAIAAALTHGAPGWRPLGHLLRMPGVSALAARVYRWVAGHRYELPGGTAACRIEQPVEAPAEPDRAGQG